MFVSIKKITTMGSRKLRDYFTFDKQIESLQEKLEKEEIGKDVNSFIKSKNKVSNAVENQVIRKIMLENKINELILWKGIIEDVINGYKILSIGRETVTVQYGSNVYKASVGELFTGNGINFNTVSNLNSKFGSSVNKR